MVSALSRSASSTTSVRRVLVNAGMSMSPYGRREHRVAGHVGEEGVEPVLRLLLLESRLLVLLGGAVTGVRLRAR